MTGGRYTLQLWTHFDRTARTVIEGLEVAGDGECGDPRLRSISTPVRVLVLRVVDSNDVPIAGARAEAWTSDQQVARDTDLRGVAQIAHLRDTAPTLTISAPGKRPRRLDTPHGELVVKLQPAGELTVAVVGIPAELSRERLEIWLEPDEPGGLARALRASLRKGDDAVVSTPVPGRYLVRLLVVGQRLLDLRAFRGLVGDELDGVDGGHFCLL